MITISTGFILCLMLFSLPAYAADAVGRAAGMGGASIIQHVYAAAPDIMGLEIHSGGVIPSHLSPYKPLAGDTRKTTNGGMTLVRGGKEVGWLIGVKKDNLVTFEGFSGAPLALAAADDPANYMVRSTDDAAYLQPEHPTAVNRKSKPDDWQQPGGAFPMLHRIYLRLPHPLTPGRHYTVSVANVNVQNPIVTFDFDPGRVRSESVHVNQVGFRPDDPVKRAYLSLWLGSGGGYTFPERLAFEIVDDATAKTAWRGVVGAGWPADKSEKMSRTDNFNKTDVYPIDFSGLKTPGRYRVVVDGAGCSYPFEIGADSWKKAFLVEMKGFYNQRSGVALGPPYTPFVRPRDFNPADGARVYQSTYSQLDGGDGQKALEAHNAGILVSGAWGGYHDAGDWNPRRITHMRTTTLWQIELQELFPTYFRQLNLNIPRTSAASDLMNECEFELSLFRRLQKPDGGVPYGIETNGDPIDGEVSWDQSMPAYVYAPDVQSSYLYTSVAARAAGVLAASDPREAKLYRESALKAMEWAERDRGRRVAAGKWDKLGSEVRDDRALAALSLYALTDERRWHGIFLEDTTLKAVVPAPFYGSLQRRDAAFLYARLPPALGDVELKQNARRDLIADADGALLYEEGNAWGIASDDRGKPLFLGFYSNPEGAVSLLRAYYLTHDEKYLAGAVEGSLFSAGANPSNMVYTSGVGSNPVRHPLNLDSRRTGQAAPVGLTVYGNVDLGRWGKETWITWPITYFLNAICKPAPFDWPTTENYFDIFLMPAENEFTMDQTMGPNAYVWGFLAARGKLTK